MGGGGGAILTIHFVYSSLTFYSILSHLVKESINRLIQEYKTNTFLQMSIHGDRNWRKSDVVWPLTFHILAIDSTVYIQLRPKC